jgi:DNA-binding response OmpR family regulator
VSRSSKNGEKMLYFPEILEESRFNDFLEIMERTVELGYSESLSKPLILVADDELFILQYIAHVLQLANYRVITVNTVEEAWKIFERRQPAIELVLTDVVMPGSLDGMDLAERIHQLDPSLPVLFITGALSESDPRTALMIEKQLVLRKPFFPKQLVDFVGAQIHRQSSSGLVR